MKNLITAYLKSNEALCEDMIDEYFKVLSIESIIDDEQSYLIKYEGLTFNSNFIEGTLKIKLSQLLEWLFDCLNCAQIKLF